MKEGGREEKKEEKKEEREGERKEINRNGKERRKNLKKKKRKENKKSQTYIYWSHLDSLHSFMSTEKLPGRIHISIFQSSVSCKLFLVEHHRMPTINDFCCRVLYFI